ncbi:MAG: peptide deformylase [Rhodospirillaceae bacterium]|jgi:peptide deformylase|nr:peptide deformylase [Rhodospirillaceae bacterium]MBT3929372.1 peptide deformylase [Rhodospirillaceae bacterium]MBT4772159.1 peptide deformylase [Rhodospirillaceae bacterium]MBT5359446.1 peptide deformylase [Rhodospirillaceae bacterium]MBT5768361.1 peptide deformylase [Rhodospirillaceae bacterium]
MAILKIARMGHPILRARAADVPDPTAPEVARLVDAMVETMEDADGTGLAAPQVHMSWRIVVYKVEGDRVADEDEGEDGSHDDGEDTGVPLTVLVNPVITPIGEETNLGFEACLSVPGMAGPVRRFNQVHVTYQTLAGEDVAFDAEGFHARVIQHECDHLDGILYPSRIEDMSQFGFVEELSRGQGEADETDDDATDETDDD